MQREFPLKIEKGHATEPDEPVICHLSKNDRDVNLWRVHTMNPKFASRVAPTVDLRSKMRVVYNQFNLGSCSAQAICAAVKHEDPRLDGSRLFVYYNSRNYIKTTQQDSGAYLSDGIKSLKEYGVCDERFWPHIISRFKLQPSSRAYQEAKKHIATVVYHVPGTMTAMKTVLNSGFPIVLGVLVYGSFMSREAAQTGNIPMPRPGETMLGGHAMLCVGYDDVKQVWIMQNSWGLLWGDKGFCYLPYAYLTTAGMTSDMWSVHVVT
jgi:C1A family cysteine protease